MPQHGPAVARRRPWIPLCLVVLGVPWAVAAQRPIAVGLAPATSAISRPVEGAVVGDVEAAFARIPIRGEHLTARTNGLIPQPRYRTSLRNVFGLLNHFQGIQRVSKNYLILSGSNPRGSRADLFIVRLPEETAEAGDVVATIAADSVMTHAGGLSVTENILAVPLHGGVPRNAKVVFYDVSDPEHPRKLPVEIDRPGRKASAVALLRLPNGYLLAAVLSAYDGLPRRMDFYLSRSVLFEDGFSPNPVGWRVGEVQTRAGQERSFSHFQTINFVRQADGRLYLIGLHNSTASPAVLPGRDYADLYEVVFPRESLDAVVPVLAKPAIYKTSNRLLYCRDGYCNLDAAAGVYVDPDTQSLSVYAAPGWLDGDTVKVTLYKGGN